MSKRAPTYCRYGKNYARVKIESRWVHLGPYGSEESQAKYKRLVAQWATQERIDEVEADVVTVAEVLEAYRSWAQRYYGDVPLGRYRNLLPTIRTVRELYADLPANQFSPKKLKVVRQAFVDRGNSRTHVNTCTRRVVAIFAWAAEHSEMAATLPTVQTSRGYHVYARSARELTGRKFDDGELRGQGHYVVASPSTHPDGPSYRWTVPLRDEIPQVDLNEAGFLRSWSNPGVPATQIAQRREHGTTQKLKMVVCCLSALCCRAQRGAATSTTVDYCRTKTSTRLFVAAFPRDQDTAGGAFSSSCGN